MAIAKIGVLTDPPAVGDYTRIIAHLNAFARQVGQQQSLIDDMAAAPSIALGAYIQHGGIVYQVQTEAYAVTGAPTAGKNYISVAASGESLVLSLVTDISGYTYSAIYNGWYDGDENQLLPYLVNYAGATYGYSIHDYNLANGWIEGYQCDLLVTRTADLALLLSAGTYPVVRLLEGTFSIGANVPCKDRGVEKFIGAGIGKTILDVAYVADGNILYFDEDALEIGGFTISSSETQTGVSIAVIRVSQGTVKYELKIHDIYISGFDDQISGFVLEGSARVDNCLVSHALAGFYSLSSNIFISNCMADNCPTGFRGFYGVSLCMALSCSTYGFVNCIRMSSCLAHSCGIGVYDCDYISSTSALSNTTNWSTCTLVDYDSTNCNQEWAYGNSGANVTTSGWVIPLGTYQFVKSSAASVSLEVYDGSGWIASSNGIINTTDSFAGVVISDGVNMRLKSSSGTQTVYWRKKP